ncbi:MAG: hypothetical protein GX993_01545 [Bacteroidales bacterium]|nr:hypothetical protein [Bacteroidales bacterium]
MNREVINSLEGKIGQLIARCEKLEKENRRLSEKVTALEGIDAKQIDTIKRLKEQIERLQLIEAFGNMPDRNEAKKRVSSLIREIDRCINLLNG